MQITAAQIKRFSPTAKDHLVKAIVDNWHLASAAGIDANVNRMWGFFGNIGVETGGLRAIEENLNYRSDQLRKVFKKYFPTEALAAQFARDPEAIANRVYGGRLGNTQHGDGWRYRGGGMMQTTGRANYAAISKRLETDFVNNPEWLQKDPDKAFIAAVQEWKQRNCNKFADKADWQGLRRSINGGLNGYDHFKSTYLPQAMKAWPSVSKPVVVLPRPQAETAAPGRTLAISTTVDEEPTIVPGSATVISAEDGHAIDIANTDISPEHASVAILTPDPVTDKETVLYVQNRFRELNMKSVGIPDGKLSTWTEEAILSFRAKKDLPLSKSIDGPLLIALATSKPFEIPASRSEAPDDVVRSHVPEVKSNYQTKIMGFVTSAMAAVGAFFTGIVDNFDSAKGYISPVKEYLSDVPGWAWLAVIAVVGGAIAIVSRTGEIKGTEAFKTGARR